MQASNIDYDFTQPAHQQGELNAQGDLIFPSSSSQVQDHKYLSPTKPSLNKDNSYNSQGQYIPSPSLTYPSLYNDRDADILIQEEYPNVTATAIPLSKADKKRAKKEAKQQRKLNKWERKRQRVENKMIAKQPTIMRIIAVPLVAGEDLIMVTTNQVPAGRIREKVEDKWTRVFTSLRDGEVYTIKGKTMRWTNRQFEGLSPDTRLLANTPATLQQISIVHPAFIPEERAFDDLVNLAITSKRKHKKRLIICSVAFPFIAGAEAIAPVWPNIITVVDAAFIVFHAKAYRGSKRLSRFIANSPSLVSCDPSLILDKWIDVLASSPNSVLDEGQIMQMCNGIQKEKEVGNFFRKELGAPELIETLCELRRRYLRQTNQQALLPPKQR